MALMGKLYFYTKKGTEGGKWAFKTLGEPPYFLRDEDILIIYDEKDPDKEILWQGDISLRYDNTFSEHFEGIQIRSEQRGVDVKLWTEWFVEEYPAKLVKMGPRKDTKNV